MAIDLHSNVKVTTVIKAHSPSATGTIDGVVIDTSGFRSNEFILSAGLQTTAGITVVPIITEGAATGSLTSVADANLLGTEAGANLSGTAGASSSTRIGYAGSKRYITCDLAVGTGATGTYNVVVVQGNAIKAPHAQ